MQTNPQLELAASFVKYTGEHIFLTGKAGTGKTTFLHRLRENSPKRMVVVAPTGVAAINARGVTIHSFFQLPFGPLVDMERMNFEKFKFSKDKLNIIRSLSLLVIDEISMVRADLLDAIDVVLRRYRDHNKPFGGVQLLMIGDLQQLAPVVTDSEKDIIETHYDNPYFFSSRALRKTSFVSIELTQVFRQQDAGFVALLNKVRENKLDADAIAQLNSRYIPNFAPRDDEGYITLCTHNHQGQRINEAKLQLLSTPSKTFKAEIVGNFPDYSHPTDAALTLKEGAQVMFVKNDSSGEKRYYNGKIGRLIHLYDKENLVAVRCPDDSDDIIVSPETWENIKFTINPNTNEISEQVEGSFTQLPLKLAWAITIHKSQGLTFERAIIDAHASFAHGQVYVALSRCKTLEGMVLSSRLSTASVINDRTIEGFTQHIEANQPDERRLSAAKIAYQHEQLNDTFSFVRLRNHIGYLLKLVNDNRNVIPAPTQALLWQMQREVQDKIVLIGIKFAQQLTGILAQQPDAEQNSMAQERITKASAYFSAKIAELIFDTLPKADIETDNKAIKKELVAAVERITDEARIKYACMQACLNRFDIVALLNAKAVAAIEKVKPKIERTANEKPASTGNAAQASTAVAHPALFEKLRSWRYKTAEMMNIPVYAVFSQKALYDLCERLPSGSKELRQINGIGDKKVQQFGDDILSIINEYCEANNVPRQELSLRKPEQKPSPPAGNTVWQTLQLFREGKSPAEIATQRGLAQSTIEGHLARLVESGDIPISDVIPNVKLEAIVHYFEANADASLTTAKTVFGNGFSYGELRIGMMEFLRRKETIS